jgi:hypothetical protein
VDIDSETSGDLERGKSDEDIPGRAFVSGVYIETSLNEW